MRESESEEFELNEDDFKKVLDEIELKEKDKRKETISFNVRGIVYSFLPCQNLL